MTRKPASKTSDVVTLADLAPRRPVVGGSERRVFGADLGPSKERALANAKKDLPTKKSVKAGRMVRNDNLTLVRAARPATRDLPARKPVKAGKKAR